MSERIVILGSGESGVGSAILAKEKGFDVFVSDKSEIKEHYKKQLIEEGIDFEENKHTKEKILNAKEIIKSPGIPDNAPLVLEVLIYGIPVIS
jgi:UDP-N-acetylmuramoylalanine--D-glutamate ligase